VVKPVGKKPLGRPRRGMEDNDEISLKYDECHGLNAFISGYGL
jgi:hypothetical protein